MGKLFTKAMGNVFTTQMGSVLTERVEKALEIYTLKKYSTFSSPPAVGEVVGTVYRYS